MILDRVNTSKVLLPIWPLHRYNSNTLSYIIYIDIEILLSNNFLQMTQKLICDCTIEHDVIDFFLE